MDQVEGAPIGTRGGIAVTHNFPADGEYVFAVVAARDPDRPALRLDAPFDEKIEVSVNGERVALLDIDRWMSQADPNGLEIKTNPIPVRAGPQRVTAAFLTTFDGPVNDLIAPIGHSIADTQIGSQIGHHEHARTCRTSPSRGPYNPTGVSETPSRQSHLHAVARRTPTKRAPAPRRSSPDLGGEAYRRPLTPSDVKALMAFYDEGATRGRIRARDSHGARGDPGEPALRLPHGGHAARRQARRRAYAIGELDLASRLSFFLWGEPPDDR